MYNKAILIGRLTADPELRQTPNGTSVTSFSIALNRTYSSRSGERQTDFFDIVCWQRQAEFVCKYFRKGNAIGVEGRIEMRDYTDKSGNKRRVYEIIAENVFFVESKAAANNSAVSFDIPDQTASSLPSAPSAPSAAPASNVPTTFASGSFSDFEEIEEDDDLPF